MRYVIDNRVFETTQEYKTSTEWRNAFPRVYSHLPAHISKSFAKRDFNKKIPLK